MATSIIKGGVESFTGTRSSGLTGGYCLGTYDNRTGLVTISWNAMASANIPATTALYTIPSKYRPSGTVSGTALGLNTSSGIAVGNCSVNASGELKQGASNARSAYMGMVQYTV